MQEPVSSPLSPWESYYVIVGSSAAALTGLQFVVIALIADSQRASTTKEIDAFGTPTIVHFCAALLMSATLSAPWQSLTGPALVLGISGVSGTLYVALVTLRAKRQTRYTPVFEDWLWHSLLPFGGYAALVVAALTMGGDHGAPLFVTAAVALLLVFIGIHNAWDTVTYLAVTRQVEPDRSPVLGEGAATSMPAGVPSSPVARPEE